MKYTLENMIDFLEEHALVEEIDGNTNICDDIGLIGDDFDELMEGYANEQVKRIPLTPVMLTEFANKGKWDLVYPQHEITLTKYNNYFYWFILLVWVGFIIYRYIL